MENLNHMLRDYISTLVGVMVDEEPTIRVALIHSDTFYHDTDGPKTIYLKTSDQSTSGSINWKQKLRKEMLQCWGTNYLNRGKRCVIEDICCGILR